MKLPKIPVEETPSGEPAPKKSPWTMVLNSTPIIMTVLATVLAGLSSSEMTLAQYHRALAAQNQSKAGDQWGFFQAKRIRGLSIQSTIDVLSARSEPEAVDGQSLLKGMERIGAGLEQIERMAGQLSSAGGSSSVFQQPLAEFTAVASAASKEAAKVQGELKQILEQPNVKEAIAYLGNSQLPQASTRPIDGAGVSEAIAAIIGRQTEKESARLVKIIAPATLEQALETAETNIAAVENANKPASDALTPVDRLLQREGQLVRSVARAVRPLERGADTLNSKGNHDDQRNAIGQLVKAIQYLGTDMEALNTDYHVARNNFLARRYKVEADTNQAAATVYELQVRKSSQMAEQHRERSKNFFYCMLAAQAGVTIGTFSLAFKHKSLLWGLASLAGLTAVSVSVYVYLYM
jgi:hypothetical protein